MSDTMSDEGGQQLWFTELHLDLFRIVHEHVELGIGTGIEVVLFNVLLSSADFLVDVQNELLAKCRSLWRSLGFVYLCALINNCRRCAELWEAALERCRDTTRSPLTEGLADNLHLGFVNDGFANLGYAAMQLAAQRVLVQLERPLGALFAGGKSQHQPNEMAAVIDHFLQMVRDGVAGSHATRTCAVCLEQLLLAYGAMLFVQEAPLSPAVPATVATDLAVFDQLLQKHCASGPFASRYKTATRVRADALLHTLRSLHELLARVLAPDDAEAISEALTQLLAQQPALTRELLARLLSKCKANKAVQGRKGAALIDAAELAARRVSAAQPHAPVGLGESSAGGAEAAGEAARVCAKLFDAATEAVAMGRKGFTVVRLLETLGTTKRW